MANAPEIKISPQDLKDPSLTRLNLRLNLSQQVATKALTAATQVAQSVAAIRTSSLTLAFSGVYGIVGTPFAGSLVASGGSGNYTFLASGLPAGLSVDTGTGVISGTPTTAGNFPVSASVTDQVGNTSTASCTMIITLTAQTRTVTASGSMRVSDYIVLFNTSSISSSSDTLNGAINSSVTSITLASGTATQTGTQLQIGSEKMLITAGGGTSSLTVERGYAGTTAASHSNGAAVLVAGCLTFDLLAISTVPNRTFYFTKVSTDINYVELVASSTGCIFPGNPTPPYIILADTSAALGSSTMAAPGSGTVWIVTAGPGAAGASSTPPPNAPNITGATVVVSYAFAGNGPQNIVFSGTIGLPTTDPNYSHLQRIDVFAVNPAGVANLIASFIGPWSGSTLNYSGVVGPQGASATWSEYFQVYNEVGAPTASPVTLTGISVVAAALTSVSMSEYGTRYADANQSLQTTLAVIPVVTGGQLPMNVTVWIDFDDGKGWIWQGWTEFTTSGQAWLIGHYCPTNTSQTSWSVAAAVGAIPYTPTPPTGYVSNTLTVPVAGAPSATGATISISAITSVVGDPTTGSQLWSTTLTVITPGPAGDPNSAAYAITVLNTNSSGTPGGVVYGRSNTNSKGDPWTDFPNDGGTYVRTLSGNYQVPGSVYTYTKFFVWGYSRTAETNYPVDSYMDPTYATAQTWPSIDGGGTSYIQDYGAQPAGAIPAANITPTLVSPPPNAPNITGATVVVSYAFAGNGPQNVVFSGTITLPTSDPNYSHLHRIDVFAVNPAGVAVLISTLTGGWSGSTVNYGGVVGPQGAAATWSEYFLVSNEAGAPTASPVTLTGISVAAAALTSVSMSEYGTRYADENQSLQTTLSVIPVVTAGQLPMNVTVWINFDDGEGWIWQGWTEFTTGGQAWLIGHYCPTNPSQTSWSVAAAVGAIPSTPTPPTGYVSNTLTVPVAGVPSATGATISISAITSVVGDPTTGSQLWSTTLTVVTPGPAGDPNCAAYQVTILNTNSSGTPGGVVYGRANTNSRGDPWTDFPNDGGTYVRTLAGNYQAPGSSYTFTKFFVWGYSRTAETNYPSDSYMDPTYATAQTWPSIDGSGSSYIQDYGAQPAGAIPLANITPTISVPPPNAPNIVGATVAVSYAFAGNGPQNVVFAGVITLPTSDPNYSHLHRIDVFAVSPAGVANLIASFIGPWGGSTLNYSGVVGPQGVAAPWSEYFQVYNEAGAPTASPVTLTGISVSAAALTSVSMSETGARWADANQSLHTTLSVIPVVTAGQLPMNVTVWINIDNGQGWLWQGWTDFTTSGQAWLISFLCPTNTGQTSWSVAAAVGAIPSTATPPTGYVSSTLTVPVAGAPSATGATISISAVTSVVGDPTTGSQLWQTTLTVVTPGPAGDPTCAAYAITVLNTNSSGTPGGVVYGRANTNSRGDPWTDFPNDGGTYVRTLSGNYQVPGSVYTYTKFFVWGYSRTAETNYPSDSYMDPTYATAQTWPSIDGGGTSYIQDYGAQPAGAIPAANITPALSVPPPNAPNITGATVSVSYAFAGNGPQNVVFAGVITLPTSDPNYSHLHRIDVFAVNPAGVANLISSFIGPWGVGVSTLSYSGVVGPQAAATWSEYFQVYNEDGVPTASPLTFTSIGVDAAALTSVGMSETGARWADANQSLHTTLSVIPVVTAGQLPMNVTVWINIDNGQGWLWQGWTEFTTGGQAWLISFPCPTNTGQTSWSVAAAVGAIPSTATPPTGYVSSTLTVPVAGAPSATGATISISAVTSVVGDPTTGSQLWQTTLTVVTPGPAGDAACAAYAITVLNTNSSGTPGGVVYGRSNTNSRGDPWTDFPNDGSTYIRTLSGNYQAPGSAYTYTKFFVWGYSRTAETNYPSDSYMDPTYATAQMWPSIDGSGSSYIQDYGAQPAGAIPATNINPATLSNTSNLVLNPIFATGDFSGWYTYGTISIVTSPVYSYNSVTGLGYAACLASNGALLGENGHHTCAATDQFYGYAWVANNSSANGSVTVQLYCFNGTSLCSPFNVGTVTVPHNSSANTFTKIAISSGSLPTGTNNIVIGVTITGESGVGAQWYVGSVYLSTVIPAQQMQLGTGFTSSGTLAVLNTAPSFAYVSGQLTSMANSGLTPGVAASGAYTWNYSSAGPAVEVGSAGITLVDNYTTPVNKVAVSSGGVSLENGSNQVSVTSSAVGIYGPAGSLVASSAGVVITNGSNGISVTPSNVGIYSPSGSLVASSTGVVITNGQAQAIFGADYIQLEYNGTPYFTVNSSGATIGAGATINTPSISGGSMSGTTLVINSGSRTINIDATNVIKLSDNYGGYPYVAQLSNARLTISYSSGLTSSITVAPSGVIVDTGAGQFMEMTGQYVQYNSNAGFTGTLAAAIAAGKNVGGGIIY